MSFLELTSRTVRWRPLGGDGFEHLTVAKVGDRITADSVVIGARDAPPYGVRYRIVCDAGWTVLSLDIEATDGRGLQVRSDGQGAWTDGDGRPLADFDGCIDIDLGGSPFTNTLPIRRLALTPEMGPVEMKMLWVPFDTFEPFVDAQRYRCLEAHRLYRFEAVDGTFAADLPVDEDGLVLDYPTLFERVHLEPTK
jgi:uncharacterized protein